MTTTPADPGTGHSPAVTDHPKAQKPKRPQLRLALTVLQLGALGLLGWGVISILFMLLGLGLGGLFLLGIGIVLLIALVYTLFGIAWFEVERVAGLYQLDVPGVSLLPRQAPGFGGYLRTIARQAIDGQMWRGVASFALATTMGTFMLACFQGLVWALFAMFGVYSQDAGIWVLLGIAEQASEPGAVSGWNIVLLLLSAVISLAGIVGLALLHRVITVAIARAGAQKAQLTRQVQTSARQREGAVRAADVERTRIERDLHDGVQPRLVSVGMTLGLAQQQIEQDPEGAKQLIAEAHTSTKAAITELRQLARGIHASVLDDRGLDAALSALAGRSHIPVHLDVRIQGRCSREAETAVYFAVAESLTNAAKHSRASECRVVVRLREDGTLWARVEDNGIGGARVLPGGGLDGISNRIVAAGGMIRLDSPQGGPTAMEVSVPCAS